MCVFCMSAISYNSLYICTNTMISYIEDKCLVENYIYS